MNFKQFGSLLPDNPLCGISTYKDTLNLATGACTRQIKKLVLDGTEDWTAGGGNSRYIISVNNIQNYAICSHFAFGDSLEQNEFDVVPNRLQIRFNNAGYTTLEAWQTYLAQQYANSTPVAVWYVLSTPTTETITVPSGLSGTEEGYLNQSGTPTPTNPIYPTDNEVEVWHDIPHYIYNTSTDTITTLPADLYPNDTTATVGLKGNMSQTGTPTPDNPIQPQECGERTGNLFDIESWLISKDAVFSKDGNAYTFSASQSMFSTPFYFSDTDIPVSISGIITDITAYNTRINLLRADGTTAKAYAITAVTKVKKNENIVCAGLQFDWSTAGTMRIDSLMLNTGSTALPYEPWGYKIPISSASTTTTVYLGEVQTTRKIKKLVLTGEENWALEYTDNFLLNPAIDNAQPLQLVMCTHQQSITTGYEYDTNFENVRISQTKKLNFRTLTIPHTLSDFKSFLQQQYAAGTPVTIWYVLATEETGIVNEPLRKIGDYADTVSGITIPTIAGANSFDVLTTLKPSEVTVNYKGWHTGTVHERENGAWTE